MKLFVVVCIIAIFPSNAQLCVVSGDKRTPEQFLSDYSAARGISRLAKHSADKTGIAFISAALKMDPDNECALLTAALLKRERPIKAEKTKHTDARFAKLLQKRANDLFTKCFPDTKKSGDAIRLYYLLAEKILPQERANILGLAKLGQRGVTASLDEILAEDGSVA